MDIKSVDRPNPCRQERPFFPTGDVFIDRMPGPGRPVGRIAHIRFAADAFGGDVPTAIRMSSRGSAYPITRRRVATEGCRIKTSHFEARTPCKHFPDAGTHLAEVKIGPHWVPVALDVRVAQ